MAIVLTLEPEGGWVGSGLMRGGGPGPWEGSGGHFSLWRASRLWRLTPSRPERPDMRLSAPGSRLRMSARRLRPRPDLYIHVMSSLSSSSHTWTSSHGRTRRPAWTCLPSRGRPHPWAWPPCSWWRCKVRCEESRWHNIDSGWLKWMWIVNNVKLDCVQFDGEWKGEHKTREISTKFIVTKLCWDLILQGYIIPR